jgi:hypothetical protein
MASQVILFKESVKGILFTNTHDQFQQSFLYTSLCIKFLNVVLCTLFQQDNLENVSLV